MLTRAAIVGGKAMVLTRVQILVVWLGFHSMARSFCCSYAPHDGRTIPFENAPGSKASANDVHQASSPHRLPRRCRLILPPKSQRLASHRRRSLRLQIARRRRHRRLFPDRHLRRLCHLRPRWLDSGTRGLERRRRASRASTGRYQRHQRVQLLR